MPASLRHLWKVAAALAALLAAAPPPAAFAAPVDNPVAGQQVRFPQGACIAIEAAGQ